MRGEGIRKPGSRRLWYPREREPLPIDWKAQIDEEAERSGHLTPLLVSIAISAGIAVLVW